MSYPAPLPHDPVEPIADDVFMVRGSVNLNALMSITRNMAIVRHAGELTLVNSVRLDAQEEQKLRALGTVKRILRLGPFHGMDDRYYMDTFKAELWAPGESKLHPEPKVDLVFDESTVLPFPGAKLFCFHGLNQPEGALWLDRGRGLMLFCDAVQNYGDYRYCNFPARTVMPWIGFPKTTIVGPFWMKLQTPEGASLEGEFRRLLGSFDFDTLLSAHGSLLRGGAHASVGAAVDRAYRK
jgi:hypothetical protein